MSGGDSPRITGREITDAADSDKDSAAKTADGLYSKILNDERISVHSTNDGDRLLAQASTSSTIDASFAQKIAAEDKELSELWNNLSKDKLSGASSIPIFTARADEIARSRLRYLQTKVDPDTWSNVKEKSRALFNKHALGQDLLMLEQLSKELNFPLMGNSLGRGSLSGMQRALSVLKQVGQDGNAYNSLMRLEGKLRLDRATSVEELRNLYSAIDKNLKALFLKENKAEWNKLTPQEQQALEKKAAAFQDACNTAQIANLRKSYETAHKWLADHPLRGQVYGAQHSQSADATAITKAAPAGGYAASKSGPADANAPTSIPGIDSAPADLGQFAQTGEGAGIIDTSRVAPPDNDVVLPDVDPKHLELPPPKELTTMEKVVRAGAFVVTLVPGALCMVGLPAAILAWRSGKSIRNWIDPDRPDKLAFSSAVVDDMQQKVRRGTASVTKANLNGKSTTDYDQVKQALEQYKDRFRRFAGGALEGPGHHTFDEVLTIVTNRATGIADERFNPANTAANETPAQLFNRLSKMKWNSRFQPSVVLALGTLLGGENAEASAPSVPRLDNRPVALAPGEYMLRSRANSSSSMQPDLIAALGTGSEPIQTRSSTSELPSLTIEGLARPITDSQVNDQTRQLELLVADLKSEREAANKAGNADAARVLEAEINEFEHENPARRAEAHNRGFEYIRSRGGNVAGSAGGAMVLLGLGLGYMSYLKNRENGDRSVSRSAPVIGKHD